MIRAGFSWAGIDGSSFWKRHERPTSSNDQPSFLKVYRQHCPDLKVRIHRSELIVLDIWRRVLTDTWSLGLTSEMALRPELDDYAVEAAAKLNALRGAMQEVDEAERLVSEANCLSHCQAVQRAEAMRQAAIRCIGKLEALLLAVESQRNREMQVAVLKLSRVPLNAQRFRSPAYSACAHKEGARSLLANAQAKGSPRADCRCKAP